MKDKECFNCTKKMVCGKCGRVLCSRRGEFCAYEGHYLLPPVPLNPDEKRQECVECHDTVRIRLPFVIIGSSGVQASAA